MKQTAKGIIAVILTNSSNPQKTMFNDFLKEYPIFIMCVYTRRVSLAKTTLQTALTAGVIDQAFYDFVFDSVGDNQL